MTTAALQPTAAQGTLFGRQTKKVITKEKKGITVEVRDILQGNNKARWRIPSLL